MAQMIHSVEDLPVEWQPEWKRMKEQVRGKWDGIPGKHDPFSTSVSVKFGIADR